jgi:hypothetical protein
VMRICDFWFINPKCSIVSFQAPIVSVHGTLRLYFEPLKLRNFNFHADPYPAFHSNADPASKNNADPDLQHVLKNNP